MKYPNLLGNKNSSSPRASGLFENSATAKPYKRFFIMNEPDVSAIEAIVNKFNANRRANFLLNMSTEETSRLVPLNFIKWSR